MYTDRSRVYFVVVKNCTIFYKPFFKKSILIKEDIRGGAVVIKKTISDTSY